MYPIKPFLIEGEQSGLVSDAFPCENEFFEKPRLCFIFHTSKMNASNNFFF